MSSGLERFRTVVILAVACGFPHGSAVLAEEAEALRQLVRDSRFPGGLIVHVGCGDGESTAALRLTDRWLVHGLAKDPDLVRRARQRLVSAGVYGKVSVDRLERRHLPYVSNLANLVLAEELGDISMVEVMRVLCPEGVAYVKQGDGWTKTVKPRPREMDDWTRAMYDASGNAVSRDTMVGPPVTFSGPAVDAGAGTTTVAGA